MAGGPWAARRNWLHTMNRLDLIDHVTLAAQLASLEAQVRQRPADADLRAALFQLLALHGDWARAAAQLETCALLQPQAGGLQSAYAGTLAAEQQRHAVFAGAAVPQLAHPQPWLPCLIDALREDARGEALAAATLRSQARAAAPMSPCTLTLADDTQHRGDWLADGDSRLGPVLEFISGSHYGWLPFSALRSMRLAPPIALCDLIWQHAEIELVDGSRQVGFVPTRYPSTTPLDDAQLLARRTDWTPLGDEDYRGVGQRMWLTEHDEYAQLDLRELVFAEAHDA